MRSQHASLRHGDYSEPIHQSRSTERQPEQPRNENSVGGQHFRVKSLTSIEEESPRWVHPPMPESNPNREMQTVPSNHEFMLFGTSDSNEQNSANPNITQDRSVDLGFLPRQVQSQPTLKVTSSRRGCWQQTNSNESMPKPSELSHRAKAPQPCSSGAYFVMTTEESKRDGGGPLALGSPMTYKNDQAAVSQNGHKQNPGHHQMFQSFAERLYAREKASLISCELKELEELVFCHMAKELPEVYRQVSIEHYEAKSMAQIGQGLGRGTTHVDALESTLLQAKLLRDTYSKYESRRNEINSFHQLVDGIQVDVDEAIRAGQAITFAQQCGRPGGTESADSMGDDYSSVKHCLRAPGAVNDYESTINAIKMGSIPSKQTQSSGNKQQYESNEGFMVQIMRQQEQEIAKCNALISKLRAESSDAENTIVEQRQEIQNLCNQLKQSAMRIEQVSSDRTQLSFDQREMDNLVKRLKDELRQNEHENTQARINLKESGEVIQNLQGQISSLKHKLIAHEGASKSQISQEYAAQMKEMVDLRQHKSEVEAKYRQLAEQFHHKELQLIEMEEKGKQMLLAAQKDAQECIKYFKGLAFQAQADKDQQRPSSHSPVLNRARKPAAQNPMLKEVIRASNQMPQSLAPVQQTTRQQRRPRVFEENRRFGDRAGYNLNGVKLRMNQRAASTIESHLTNEGHQTSSLTHRQPRAQTLSPSPTSAKRANTRRVFVTTEETQGLDHRYALMSSREKNDSSLSRGSKDNGAGTISPWIELDNPKAAVLVAQTELRIDCVLQQLGDAFKEVVETKGAVSEMINSYGEQYCQQLQKFSVLAYDYLERIENLAKRDAQLDEELAKQGEVVCQLKMITSQQTEHINAQNELILAQKNQLALLKVGFERASEKCMHNMSKVGRLIRDEVPFMRDTIVASQVAIIDQRKFGDQGRTDLATTQHLLDLSKKKVKILEQELEKSLEASQSQEESLQATRKKFMQLVDLIKDIWQSEVQNQTMTLNPVMSHTSNQPRLGNHDQKQKTMDQQSELTQTINSAHMEVPMPISWLSDISDHIKQLKDMNDFQMDEVFQIVNMLHQQDDKAGKRGEGGAHNGWPANEESNSTEEDDKTSHQMSDQRLGHHHHRSLADEQKEFLHHRGRPLQDSNEILLEDEQTDTERGLEQYDEQARMMHQDSSSKLLHGGPDIGEADDLYVNTTSISKSKAMQADNSQKELTTCSPKRQEMSFSQRLDDTAHEEQSRFRKEHRHSERVGHRAGSQTAIQRRDGGWNYSSKENETISRGRRRDRSHQPSKNIDWPELINGYKTGQGNDRPSARQHRHRRSQNPKSNRQRNGGDGTLSCSDKGRGRSSGRRLHTTFAAAAAANGPHQGYRASIDMTATSGTLAVDGNKRNELYIMLKEEVLNHLKQTEVSKETVLGMKRLLRRKRQELATADQAYRLLTDERQQLIQSNDHLEGEVKDMEIQIEELQGIVQDREASMETLKMQIEDFEKELLGLQDQMTHVMKLNAEIGAASEHWQVSYQQLQEEMGRDKAKLRDDFNKNMGKKVEKIQQFKRKLQEKENTLNSIRRDLHDATTYREEFESKRNQMLSSGAQTDPAMELLEQHKEILENKLNQVKQDVSTVLDQVEREQSAKDDFKELLNQQKETSKSLVAELGSTQKDCTQLQKQIQKLQKEVKSREDEITRMTEAMEQDQEQYQQQIEQAERINGELQTQVEQVTRAAEELQDHYTNNENLNQNMEIQEQKIFQLEEELMYLQEQIDQKDQQIAGYENSILSSSKSRTTHGKGKRETRSVSLPRSSKRNQSSSQPSPKALRNSKNLANNNLSQMLPQDNDGRFGNNSSVSKSSFILSRETKIEQSKDDNFCPVDEFNNTLQTNQSMFEENMGHHDSATFSRLPHVEHDERLNNANTSDMQVTRSNYHSSQRQISKKKQKPPRNQQQQQNARQKTPKTTHGDSTTVHWRGTHDYGNSRQDTSVNLDISPGRQLAKTQTAVSTNIGQSQMLPTCCCGTTNCMNTKSQAILAAAQASDAAIGLGAQGKQVQHKRGFSRTGGFGKQTAIDDLQSSYKQFKAKQDTGKESRKKLRKALHMTEVLIKYYLNEAKLKSENRIDSHRLSSPDVSKSHTLNELQKQMTQWEAQLSGERRGGSSCGNLAYVNNDEVSEAQAYFQKRNQNVIDCLKALVQHVTPSSHYSSESAHTNQKMNYHSSEMTVMKTYEEREPPQIVSGRRLGTLYTSDERNQFAETQMSGEPQVNEMLMTANSFDGYGKQPVNITIEQRHGRNEQQIYSGHQTLRPSPLVSSRISCQNCTATFTQSQSQRQDMLSQYKVLFQKFLQTGRSLAGICFGGSMFMGDQLRLREKRSVESALSFLAKDSSEFEQSNGGSQNLDEFWTVVDDLLACLSKIVSSSCQNFIKANSQLMDAKKQSEAFDSIHQKSVELSIDQNHQISRLERASFCESDLMQNTTDINHMTSNNGGANMQSIASSQVGSKMLDLEQRIKNKFSNIRSLETLLDTILGKSKDQAALLPQLTGDSLGLQKVFLNIRRAVCKLKIELHQDYLQLSQVNLHFQMPGSAAVSQASNKDHHASLTMNNFEIQNQYNHQSQSRQPTSFTQPFSQMHAPLRSGSNHLLFHQKRDSAFTVDSGSAKASAQAISSFSSMPSMQPMLIGSAVLQPSGGNPTAVSAREPISPSNNTPQMMYPLQGQLSSSGMPPHPTITNSRQRGLHQHHTSMGNPSPSQTMNGSQIVAPNQASQQIPGPHSFKPFSMHSARDSSMSGATSTVINITKNSHIDRIVEELQGLTFEYSQEQPSNGGNAQHHQATTSTQMPM